MPTVTSVLTQHYVILLINASITKQFPGVQRVFGVGCLFGNAIMSSDQLSRKLQHAVTFIQNFNIGPSSITYL
jgi:hypothetical protein